MSALLQTGMGSSVDEERGSSASTTIPDLPGKIPSELCHRHEQRLLVHKEKRRRRQTSKCSREISGWHRDFETECFFAGTRRRNHVHGGTWSAHEAPRIFSWAFDKTFERWNMSHQTPPSMTLSAPFAGMEGSKVDGILKCFRGRPVHQGRATRPHSGISERYHPDQRIWCSFRSCVNVVNRSGTPDSHTSTGCKDSCGGTR